MQDKGTTNPLLDKRLLAEADIECTNLPVSGATKEPSLEISRMSIFVYLLLVRVPEFIQLGMQVVP